MTPTSILLLPAPKHREALLGDSPGGGTPPLAYEEGGVWHVARHYDEPEALILRWHGEDDPMGIERLLHVMRSRPIAYAGLESVLAAFAVERFGRVIYLDADGREVKRGITVNPGPGTFDVPPDAIVVEGTTLPPLVATPLYSRDVADNAVSFFHDLGDRRTAFVIGCDAADGGGWSARVEGVAGSEAKGVTKDEAMNRAAEKAAAILSGRGPA